MLRDLSEVTGQEYKWADDRITPWSKQSLS